MEGGSPFGVPHAVTPVWPGVIGLLRGSLRVEERAIAVNLSRG